MADSKGRWYNWLFRQRATMEQNRNNSSWLRSITSGSLYRVSDIRGISDFNDIKTQIDTMRALANDSQINTALNYYATDATTTNGNGQIIWATTPDPKYNEVADIINDLFKRWNVINYARDHILELATIGNLYMPTSYLYKDDTMVHSRRQIVLDNNTIPENDFDIIPSYKIPPDTIVHLWKDGVPCGYLMDPEDNTSEIVLLPEAACIHFSLGGLLGDYKLESTSQDGLPIEYDIQFATPLMSQAVQPTQTLSLLEDAVVLSSLSRTIKFINVRCGTEEDEMMSALQMIKDTIEQQLSLHTGSGDIQSFVNPQSPNNLIYLPKVNGADAISITDLNMADNTEADNKLLDYYQNKKLSVLGIPKEAMNFSSAEGLGAAGTVMSQRSALYANILERLMTAYKNGWTKAINTYFQVRNLSGYVDSFELHMNPIVTTQSTIQFDKRDAALNQATTLIQLLKDAGVTEEKPYTNALIEILAEVFPKMAADATNWNLNVSEGTEGGGEVGI